MSSGDRLYWVLRNEAEMKSSLPAMTTAERYRADVLKRELGCVACRQLGITRQADLHHMLSGGYRISHMHTVPICPWHHRSMPIAGHTIGMTRDVLGPSLHDDKRAFEAEFGTERELLDRANQWFDGWKKRVVGGIKQ